MHGFTVVNITEHIGFSTILANCSARCPPLELFIGKMVRFYHSQFQYLHQTYYVINAKNISPYTFQVQIDGHIRYLGIIKTLSFRFETEKLWVIKSSQSLDNVDTVGFLQTLKPDFDVSILKLLPYYNAIYIPEISITEKNAFTHVAAARDLAALISWTFTVKSRVTIYSTESNKIMNHLKTKMSGMATSLQEQVYLPHTLIYEKPENPANLKIEEINGCNNIAKAKTTYVVDNIVVFDNVGYLFVNEPSIYLNSDFNNLAMT